jgi:hypothetical protein
MGMAAWRFGTGKGCVYCYGYDGIPGRMKIGHAKDREAWQRIKEQMNESSPGEPLLLVVLQTDEPRRLETALHDYFDDERLRCLGQKTEWFTITVNDIVALILWLQKQERVVPMWFGRYARERGNGTSDKPIRINSIVELNAERRGWVLKVEGEDA